MTAKEKETPEEPKPTVFSVLRNVIERLPVHHSEKEDLHNQVNELDPVTETEDN